MSIFDLTASVERAASRLARRRADAGHSRLPAELEAELGRLLGTVDKPSMLSVRRSVSRFCRDRGLREPSRATLYNAIERVPSPAYSLLALPPHIRRCLHNLDDDAIVPGPQVAFAVFNRGESAALSWAAGMPWLCLKAAMKLPGFRPKSRALLDAVLRYRGVL
jgi:hypothetical protein